MSAAMVELCTPSVSSNPSDKAQTFTPLFDRPSSDSSSIRSMDESNSFQFPPVSFSGKPSLSKPRLLKVRKNAPQRKPSTVAAQEPAAGAGFNPFRSERIEVVPESGARVSESSNASSGAGAFVFGSDTPNLSRNLSVKSEGEPREAQEAGMGRSFSFGSEGRGDSSSNSFVFGSGVQKNGVFSRDSSLGSDEGLAFSKLVDDTMTSGVEREKQAENVFVFGGSSMYNRSMEKAEPTAASASFKSERSVRPDAGKFVFGSGVKNSADSSQDSSLGLNEGLLSKLAEETRMLNLNNPANVDELQKTKKQAENVFVFGGSTSANKLSESSTVGSASSGRSGSGSSDAGAFVFGSRVSADFSQNSSIGSEEGSFSLFGEQTRKLDVDDFEKKKQAESAFSFGSSKSASGVSFGVNVTKLPDSAVFASKSQNIGLDTSAAGLDGLGSKTTGDAGTFAFGSQVNKDDVFSAKLPDEMKKMNLSSGDDDEKAESADNAFVSGASKSSTGSFECDVPNKAAEENHKLNVETEAVGSSAGVFVFGSNLRKSSISSRPSTNKGSASDLPNDNKSSTEDLDKDKFIDCEEKIDIGNGFAFGSSGNASASFGRSASNTLRDDLDKMKIGSETDKLAGNTPFEPAFREGNQYSKGSVPSFGSTFTFLGKSAGLDTQHMEFKTPKQDATRLTKESLFTGTDQSVPFSVKKCDAKSAKAKKKRAKPKQPAPLQQSLPKHFTPVERESQENPEVGSAGSYSPMDYSPYRDGTAADQCSREPSLASVDSIHFASRGSSADTQRSVSLDEQEEILVSEAEKSNLDKGNLCQEEIGDNDTDDSVKRSSSDDSASADEQISQQDAEKDIPKHENAGFNSNLRTGSAKAETGSFISKIEGKASEGGIGFTFSSNFEDVGESNFRFSASPSIQGPFSASKHNYKRRSRSKSGQPVSTTNASPSTSPLPDLIPPFDTSGLPDLAALKSTSTVAQSEDESKPVKYKEPEVSQESTSSAAAGVAAREACEKWRFRGNQAYANGLLSKAEDYYTRGINSVSRREIPSSCIQPLTLCYSNRAATRMSLGRMREALSDCKMAVLIDPNFLKARVRIGNCLLALGETGEALKQFKKCLQLEKNISSNQKYISEATDGLQKAQQLGDITSQAAELLLKRMSSDASKALNMISEALSISPHSESLMEMKAEALLVMRNYEEVIKMCERTLDLAEINSVMMEDDSQDSSGYVKSSSAKLWRWHLIAKSYFYLGKLDEALELLEHEEMKSAVYKYMNGSAESSTTFADTIRELLRLKSAGNEAFQARRHSEAVEYYTAALACNAESRPFSAVCFCNRAAAYQALGQITEAIADCSLAIAVDSSYPKAISRRATLHEMIRDYGHAANDLNRLISVLENQVGEKFNQSGAGGRSTTISADLKRARARLAAVEEESRKGISLNMYMILGVEPSSSAADIKKAYRKAALRHHPDKAGQVFVRNENVEDGLWKEVAAEVQADADRLFKMIGEAYTILSDPTKRMQYDDEEEMRTAPRKSYGSSYGNYGSTTPRSSSDGYTSYSEKNFSRRQWRTRDSSYQQW